MSRTSRSSPNQTVGPLNGALESGCRECGMPLGSGHDSGCSISQSVPRAPVTADQVNQAPSDWVQHDHGPQTAHGLPIIGMPWHKPTPFPLACYDCFLRYGEAGWMDAHVPNEVWAKIAPSPSGGGVLCITCMARRCLALNIECKIQIGSGPFTLGQTY